MADEWIERYYPEILRYCLWHAPNRSLAEDAAQETFLKAVRYGDRYIHRGRFRPFLYRIAANTCIDLHRKASGREVPFAQMADETADLNAASDAMESDLVLRQLVHDLPNELRELVLLRFGQDMTIREVAEAVGLPMRTVQSRLRTALKRLRNELAKGDAL